MSFGLKKYEQIKKTTACPDARAHDWEDQMLYPIIGQLEAGFSNIPKMHHNGKYYSYTVRKWTLRGELGVVSQQNELRHHQLTFQQLFPEGGGIISRVIAGERQR